MESVAFVTFTCEKCGEKQCFKANTLFKDEGECCKCGHVTRIRKYGLIIAVKHVGPKREPHLRVLAFLSHPSSRLSLLRAHAGTLGD